MAKDPSNMTHAERMAALMRDLNSPVSVAKADKMLELIGHEYLDILGLREMAARRHGAIGPAPVLPAAPSRVASITEATDRSIQVDDDRSVVSVRNLADRYRQHKHSPYHKLRFKTRETYDGLINRLIKDCGDDILSELKARNIEHLHDSWTESGTSMAHSLVTMLRGLINFGVTVLDDGECERLQALLHNMHFKNAGRRTERLTVEQAAAIRAKAHEMGWPSVALAQAFQFDCGLRQKDVIGEWVPLSEPGNSDVCANEKKWLRGLRHEEISKDLVLRHVSSVSNKEFVFDLKTAPMVMEELRRKFADLKLPSTGAVILSEGTKLPWTSFEFRRQWRKFADAAGVPRSVFNMDSRAKTADSKSAEPQASGSTEDLAPSVRH